MRFTDQEKRERERREGGRDRKTKIERENNFLKIIIFCSFSLEFTSMSGIVKNKLIVTNAKV